MKKEMLINVLQPEEIRIAIVEDGVLEELYVERSSHESYVGNIYKGRIVNIEPSIQAAFVDFGVGRNGFLHVSDVEPAYYRDLSGYGDDDRGRRGPRERGRPGGGGGGGRDRGERGDRGDRSARGGGGGGRGGRGGRGRRSRPEDDIPPMPQELMDEHASPDLPFAEPVFERGEHDLSPESVSPMIDDRDFEPLHEELPPVSDALDSDDHDAPPPTEAAHHNDEVHDDLAAEDDDEGAHESAESAERDPQRRGRRRRGKGRRPAKNGEPTLKGSAAPPETPAAPPPGASEQPLRALDDERPRPMDSAERRTDETDEPIEPLEPKASVRDEDLSFSMAPPSTAPARRAAPEPPPRVPEPAPARRAEPELPRAPVADETPLAAEPLRTVESEPATESAAAADAVSPSEDDAIHADYEQLPLHEGHLLPGEPLPPEEFTPEAEDLPPPAGETDEYPVYEEEFAPREPGRRDDRDEGRGERRERGRGDRAGGGRDRDRRPRGGRDAGRTGSTRAGFGRPKPPIQEIFKRGQEVLVQVIKEGIGTKGPTLSTYISIAGRYLVLMPGLNRIGVSRKIEDEGARRRLRDIMHDLHPPRGIGFIIRTAGIDRNRKELQRDLVYLAKLWQVIVRRIKKQKSPCDIYQESDMVTRTIRDIFTNDIDTIFVDEQAAYEHAKEFLQIVMPRFAERIKFYDEKEPMFHKYGIEQEITRIQQRHVPLPAGGSIVIDQTEALVAIDVNSGSFRADNNAETTAFQMNLQAAKEIARQLRLRDLGGVIVNDFIDMREERHRRGVERALRDAMERDRARTKILRMSQFGLIQMTRQRIRPSLKRSVYHECPSCGGTGHVKTCESMSIEVMRLLQLAVHREYIERLEVRVQEDVAHYLLNRKRQDIAKLEEASGKQIQVRVQPGAMPEHLDFLSYDNNGNEVKFMPFDEPAPVRQPRRGGRGRRGRDEER